VKRALCFAAWIVCLAVCVSTCAPPAAKKPAPPPKEEAPPAPAKKPPAPKPAKVAPAPPPAVFLLSPQQRKSYVSEETAEITLVISAHEQIPNATITLSLTNDAGTTWTATDRVGALPAGRRSITYGVDVGCFPPGSYKLTAQLGEHRCEPRELTIASSVPRTHFRIIGWVEKPPADERDALRWSRVLGLNTIFLQNRSPYGSASSQTFDAATAKRFERVRTVKGARPLELDWTVPPFIRAGDRLTSAGLQWLNCCAVSGGGQPHLRPERDFADPLVVRGARQRIHHRLLAERRFRNSAGIHFTNEATLSWVRTSGYEGPFGVPAQIEAFKKRFGVKEVPWQQGVRKWDEWRQFMAYRAGVLGECLADWADAVKAIDPRCVATSQLYAPTSLADGAYPPLQARGLPVISTQAPFGGPAGMMMASITADLQRAGNWGRPLWLMPELAMDAELDETRAAISLGLARKLEGVIYPTIVDYHLDRPAASMLATDLVAGISGLSHLLTRFGDFFLALKKPRGDVAIFYSLTEHMARIGQDPVKNPQAPAYPWTLLGAYEACMFAHFPPTFLTEEELLAGQGEKSKVILVVGLTRIGPEVKAKLEAHAAEGGVVLTDPTTKVEIAGAKPIKIEFPDLNKYHDDLWQKGEEKGVDTTLERRDEVSQAKLIYPLLRALRTELKEHIERHFTVADRDIIVCDQRCGAGRYIFVVNNTQRTDIFRGLKWELAAAKTRLTLRPGDYVIYDAVRGGRFLAPRVKGRPVIPRIMPAGGLDVFALLPQAIRGVRLGRPSHRAGQLAVSAFVHGASRWRRLNAAVPIEVIVRDPDGNERLHLYRAHTPAGYSEKIPLAELERPGEWTLVVRELLSGKSAEETFRVRRASPSWASRRGPLVAFDGERVAALLRSTKPLWIVVGTEQEAKKVEALAASLRGAERPVEVKLAGELAKPRRLSKEEAARYVSAQPDNAPMPDVRQAALLVGNIATHPLLQMVHNFGILPRAVSPDYPGQGGALVCWLISAFEPDVETVVAAAADEAGLDLALQTLAAAAGGGAPQTTWRSLPGVTAVAEARPGAGIERLAPAWRRRMMDNPTCAATSLRAHLFNVGFHDGLVAAFDNTGKLSWSHRCPSRVLALATTLDGAWTVTGSWPACEMLTSRGRRQWATPLEETSVRAGFTAVAVAPTGELTVAGTRRGQVVAVTTDGKRAFTLPPAEASEGKEKEAGWRFGEVGAVAVSPGAEKGYFVVIGGSLGTTVVDQSGRELWKSAELKHPTSVAVSLTKAPTVAVGSRAGLVANVAGGGTVLWRQPAKGYVMSVCFRGTTDEVLAASLDGSLTCYDKEGKARWRHDSPVGFRFVASSIDGEVIAAAEFAGKAILLNSNGEIVAQTEAIEGAVRAMALSGDGTRLLVGTSANEVIYFRYARPKAGVDEDEL